MSRRLRTAEILAAAGLASSDLERERQQTEREGMRQRGYLQALSALVPAGAQLARTLYGLEADKTAKAAKLADNAAATERQRTQDSLNEENIRSQMTSRTAADERAIAAEARAAAESARKAETEAVARASKAQEDAMGGLRLRAASGAPLEALIGAASADDRLGELDDDAVRGIQAGEMRKASAAKAKEDADAALAAQRSQPRGGGGPSELQRLRLDEAKAKAKAREAADDPTVKARANTIEATPLRKEFNTRPEVEKAAGSAAEYEILNSLATNPASAGGDLALVYSFMKTLDPGSVVKEGEFKAAASAAGLSDRIVTSVGKVDNGEILSPAQRLDLAAQGKVLRDGHQRRADLVAKRYGDIARRAGFDPVDVVGDWSAPAAPTAPAAAPASRRFRVSNGQRALVVDEAKLPDALADGFRVLEEVR